MIPYNVETLRMMTAGQDEAQRFAALEFRRADREWAVAAAARGGTSRPIRRGGSVAAVVSYLFAR